MAEDRNARPVSGEIMAGTDGAARARLAGDDIVDAEFETVASVTPDAADPRRPARESLGTAVPPMVGMDSLKPRQPDDAQPRAKGGPAFWVFGLAVAAGAFWVSGGHALIRQPEGSVVTQPTPPAFTVEDVTSRVEDADGRIVLFVDGSAVNSGTDAARMPPLEIEVTAGDGVVTRYKLGTSQKELAPGARFSFSSRLEAPKEGVKSVRVDFSESF